MPTLDARPDLLNHLGHVWDAFNFLCRRRQAGVATPIPLEEVTRFLDEWLYVRPADRQFMILMIDALDDEFLSFVRGKLKTKEDEDGDPKGNHRQPARKGRRPRIQQRRR